MSERWIELSYVIEHGMTTYPGLPEPSIEPWLTFEDSKKKYSEGTEFQIARITMVANTGTYLDAPSHRFASGGDIATLGIGRLVDLPGRVVSVPDGVREIAPDLLPSDDLRGQAVLFRTGWSRHFGQPKYGDGHPYLADATAEALIASGVALVGIDSLNIDGTATGERPVHTALLGAAIPLVEHLTGLEQLPESGFRFYAVPLRVRGMGSFPVRAFARL
ncbi:MAG: cyclase family protein [Planctomycetota bacterium]